MPSRRGTRDSRSGKNWRPRMARWSVRFWDCLSEFARTPGISARLGYPFTRTNCTFTQSIGPLTHTRNRRYESNLRVTMGQACGRQLS